MSDPTAIELELTQIINSRVENLKNTKLAQDLFIEQMKDKHTYLFERSPALFNKAVSGELDNPEAQIRIRQMLGLMRSIQSGNKSQDEADRIFGQVMADKYITPIVNNLDKK